MRTSRASQQDDLSAAGTARPRWCVSPHGRIHGEEDWVHVGEPLEIADGVLARLCMSVDPDARDGDGPYVLIGSSELTPTEAAALGGALIALANAAEPMSGRQALH